MWVSEEISASGQRDAPLEPGTLDMYRVRDSRGVSAGFTGYCGGLSASSLRSASDLASTYSAILVETQFQNAQSRPPDPFTARLTDALYRCRRDKKEKRRPGSAQMEAQLLNSEGTINRNTIVNYV